MPRKASTALTDWVKAVKKVSKGGKYHIPKKGTKDYAKVKKVYNELRNKH